VACFLGVSIIVSNCRVERLEKTHTKVGEPDSLNYRQELQRHWRRRWAVGGRED
jgi:hypothetical protein